VLSVVT